MFYKQFLKITEVFNPEFVEQFDYWLATLPRHNQENITASIVSSRLGVRYSLADQILRYAEKQKILSKHYLARCPKCDDCLDIIEPENLATFLDDPTVYCDECGEERTLTPDDIYVAYKVILQPDITEEQLAAEIEKRLNLSESVDINFFEADSLVNHMSDLHEAFYNPSGSAYARFAELRSKLDLDYGKNTTAKGAALETLVKDIFNEIRGVSCTNLVNTKTNQFDCTALCRYETIYESVFTYLSPYFIVECKNESKKPDNTYINKVLSILDTNEAQIGIVVGRYEATLPCFTLAREHYLKHANDRRQQIVITLSDVDLSAIIDDKVNLLDYLNFKIFQVTSNAQTTTYKMFGDGNNW